MFIKQKTVEERFWEKVDKKTDDECWNWLAMKDKDGYGNFELTHGDKKRANRIAWILSYGEIPKGILVCHKCDNPSCCNPNHLFLGTNQDNMRDMRLKGRGKSPTWKGIDVPSSKLTEDQVREIRNKYIPFVNSMAKLADEYGVNPTTIFAIVNRKSYVDV